MSVTQVALSPLEEELYCTIPSVMFSLIDHDKSHRVLEMGYQTIFINCDGYTREHLDVLFAIMLCYKRANKSYSSSLIFRLSEIQAMLPDITQQSFYKAQDHLSSVRHESHAESGRNESGGLFGGTEHTYPSGDMEMDMLFNCYFAQVMFESKDFAWETYQKIQGTELLTLFCYLVFAGKKEPTLTVEGRLLKEILGIKVKGFNVRISEMAQQLIDVGFIKDFHKNKNHVVFEFT